MSPQSSDGRLSQLLSLLCRMPAAETGFLAARLEVSDRTVRNDLRQLNDELRGCGAVEGSQGRYSLRIYDRERFRAVQERLQEADAGFNSPRARQDYLFGRLSRAGGPLLTDELAYEMNVGRSTLVSDLKKLRSALEPYALSILGKTSKGLVLEGQESSIRQYILENCFDALYRQYPLDPEIGDIANGAFQSLERGTRDRFRQFLTVMLDRFLTGHPIGALPASFYRLTARPEFAGVNALVAEIGRFLHTDIPSEEALFVLLPIIGMRTPADVMDMQAIALDPSMRDLRDRMFQQIRLELDLTIQDSSFGEEFLYHLMFMVNRLRYHVRMESAMAGELREKYPLAWRMAGIAGNVVREVCGLEVTEDERSYLASYFGVFLEESGRSRPFRAAVVCGTGRVTARLVSAQLRRVLDSATELVLLSSGKVTPEVLADFDLIFTTVELPCRTELPVIFIHEIFNEQELRHKIEKAKYWDQVDVPVLDSNWFVMAGLLDESRFFVLDGAESYAGAVRRMAEALAARGEVDAGFPARLEAREKIGSTVFDRSVALPHSVQTAGDRLILSVGVCPEPIGQDGQEVRVVFLLALPEDASKDDALLIRVYEELLSIAKDPDLLDKIASARTFQELLRALYRQA